MSLDLADDRRHRIRRELHLPGRVEALDREEEADRADLDEVLVRLAPSRVASREAANERHVPLDELVPSRLVPCPIGLDQSNEVDVLRHRGHFPS